MATTMSKNYNNTKPGYLGNAPVKAVGITLSVRDAEKYTSAIITCRVRLVREIQTAERRRNISAAIKTAMIEDASSALTEIIRLQELICEAARIRGY